MNDESPPDSSMKSSLKMISAGGPFCPKHGQINAKTVRQKRTLSCMEGGHGIRPRCEFITEKKRISS